MEIGRSEVRGNQEGCWCLRLVEDCPWHVGEDKAHERYEGRKKFAHEAKRMG